MTNTKETGALLLLEFLPYFSALSINNASMYFKTRFLFFACILFFTQNENLEHASTCPVLRELNSVNDDCFQKKNGKTSLAVGEDFLIQGVFKRRF